MDRHGRSVTRQNHNHHNPHNHHNHNHNHNHNNQAQTGVRYRFFPRVTFRQSSAVSIMAGRDTGAAKRRRDRRLRMHWRHEQLNAAYGPGHSGAPQRTAPEDGRGRGGGTS